MLKEKMVEEIEGVFSVFRGEFCYEDFNSCDKCKRKETCETRIAIELAIRAIKKDPWTPIEDEEPPKDTPVWVTITTRCGKNPSVKAGMLTETGWELVMPASPREFTVTAWSHFLEPYKGEEEKKE